MCNFLFAVALVWLANRLGEEARGEGKSYWGMFLIVSFVGFVLLAYFSFIEGLGRGMAQGWWVN